MSMKNTISDGIRIFDELSDHITIRIYSCNDIRHGADWTESKIHSDYDLWLVLTGQLELQVNGISCRAGQGDLVLFRPNMPYAASSIGEEDCHFIYLHFDFDLGSRPRILDHFPLSGVIGRTLVQEETDLFLTAYRTYKASEAMSGLRLQSCFTLLLSAIIERYGQGKYKGSFALLDSVRNQKGMAALAPALEYIQEQLDRPIRIQELAQVAGMSEKHFIVYFKQTLGLTPKQYVTQIRMNRARELLYSRNYSVQQIAGLLGYPDPYTFSKAFKRFYKVSPSHFV